MSSLKPSETVYFERLFRMEKGYVLGFSDISFAEFFAAQGVDIEHEKYHVHGGSKAKRLRAFWTLESDRVVGEVLSELLDYTEACRDVSGNDSDARLLKKARDIVGRLTGQPPAAHAATVESEFLAREFAIPSVEKLPIDGQVMPIVKARLDEARVVLDAKAYLSAIFLLGSVLEAVLLGAASQSPAKFNRANAAPKGKEGKPKPFGQWSLAQLIDVACEIGVLRVDVGKFSHGLRDFRNYIHPYQQISSGFIPDEHTAKLCFQALKAALAELAGER